MGRYDCKRSNYPCLSLWWNIIAEESNLSNLLNMYYLDSCDHIHRESLQNMAIQKNGKSLGSYFLLFYYLSGVAVGGHGTHGAHLCDPDGWGDNAKWSRLLADVITRRSEDNAARGQIWESISNAHPSSPFQTDFSNGSIFFSQVINVAPNAAWRAQGWGDETLPFQWRSPSFPNSDATIQLEA